MGRGGQIYFVHNKVQTIERIGTWIQGLVPEARILMAHGQMDERLLESVMLKFIQREADVLVTSAIIQSGLDVPNANTILVNRADMFGLAQLYQLRGRVGRGGHQAYAYFLTPDEGTLTTEAQKRLIAIQEFTELGAGFRIAAADLEIRGAGNLLGRQQSGHIAAIGLDLYIKMVEEAVQLLRGQPVKEERPDPTLHIPVSAFIPEDYMTDTHQRLSFYKRLSGSSQVGDLAILHGEMLDRYGPPPEPVERLYEVMQVRVLAKLIGVTTVEMKANTVVIVFDPKSGVSEEGMSKLMDEYHDRLRMLSPHSFELHTAHQDWTSLHPELTGALQTLVFCDTK
jgi:transcription-repair coupling factor (superfamily II helicase)